MEPQGEGALLGPGQIHRPSMCWACVPVQTGVCLKEGRENTGELDFLQVVEF